VSSEVAAGPADSEILEALGGTIQGQQIVSVRRRPYKYATSFLLEELRLGLANGGSTVVILKDLSWDLLGDDARRSKPEFLYEPRRELETYLRILRPSGVGPRCYAAGYHTSGSDGWLILEKVRGIELWQVGDLRTWESVARWIAKLHSRFMGKATELLSSNPHLLRHDFRWFVSWAERARVAILGSADQRTRELLDMLDRYDEIASVLASLPNTFVHGEFFPSNILVQPNVKDPEVWPVDWEMTAVGPGLLDTAALVAGWGRLERETLVSAYRLAMVEHGVATGSISEVLEVVSMCQLHFALQWLGWAENWRPPSEHARDWIGEALTSARELLR
jgi:aminoglycoside phosphotransferase (APT) family kinase protein